MKRFKSVYSLNLMCALLIFAALPFITSCTGNDEPNIELVQNMMESPAIKSQDYDPSAPDGRAMLLPPDNTVKRGFEPYLIADPVIAGNTLVNPVAGKVETLARGQKLYFTYCFVCHGSAGGGDGPVAEKFISKPPALTTKLARDYKDGYLFHMITRGRGLMGSYAGQIPNVQDRWAVVNFVRHLQQSSSEK